MCSAPAIAGSVHSTTTRAFPLKVVNTLTTMPGLNSIASTLLGHEQTNLSTDLRTMQDYLGHRDPKHTAHYTRVAGHRFEGLWRYPRATHCGRFLNKKRPRAED